MNLDLAAELVAALRSPSGREALREALAPVIADELQRALEQRAADQLVPLAKILGKSAKAAAMQLSRDAGLRSLGVPCGRRLLFKPSVVERYLAEKAR